MRDMSRHYIAGRWQLASNEAAARAVINPATEQPVAELRIATRADAERAVTAARRAHAAFASSSVQQRAALLHRIAEVYERRLDELALAITTETGVPYEQQARRRAAPSGLQHWRAAADPAHTARSPAAGPSGVCALLSPWQDAMQHIAHTLAPALLAGNSVVLVPANLAPLSARLLAEILDEAGTPAGVFNLIHGHAAQIARWFAVNPQIDTLSFTGTPSAAAHLRSTLAMSQRISITSCDRAIALLLDHDILSRAIAHTVRAAMQGADAQHSSPAQLLLPVACVDAAVQLAHELLSQMPVGDPLDAHTAIGPLASRALYRRQQALLAARIAAGATVLVGGPGRPRERVQGYYARPTLLLGSLASLRRRHDEDFGPLLTLLPYRDARDAIALLAERRATPLRLWSADLAHAQACARQLRRADICINETDAKPAPAPPTRHVPDTPEPVADAVGE